jgi:hypothetical protein
MDAYYSYKADDTYELIAGSDRSEAAMEQALAQIDADDSLSSDDKDKKKAEVIAAYPLDKVERYIYEGPDNYSTD